MQLRLILRQAECSQCSLCWNYRYISISTKAFGVLPAHRGMIMNVGIALISVPLMICAGFVNCHRTLGEVGAARQYT